MCRKIEREYVQLFSMRSNRESNASTVYLRGVDRSLYNLHLIERYSQYNFFITIKQPKLCALSSNAKSPIYCAISIMSSSFFLPLPIIHLLLLCPSCTISTATTHNLIILPRIPCLPRPISPLTVWHHSTNHISIL